MVLHITICNVVKILILNVIKLVSDIIILFYNTLIGILPKKTKKDLPCLMTKMDPWCIC